MTARRNSTGASPSHTYATPGSYTITLTVTDSWNRAGAPVTRDVTMTEPAGNQGPTAVIPAADLHGDQHDVRVHQHRVG